MKEQKEILQNLQHHFLYYMIHVKQISLNSLKAYASDLESFFDLQKNKKLSDFKKAPLHSLKIKNKKQIREMIQSTLQDKLKKYNKLSSSSRGRKIAVARSFIKWLREQNYINEDFRYLFKSPKNAVRLPHFLSVDEILSIMEMFKKENHFTDKDKALFFLIYGGGLRVSEACRLKSGDIHWSDQSIKIQGKGNKERIISLPGKAFQQIKSLRTNQTYFFGNQPLSERKAYDIIKSIGLRAGLLKPLHPHALRHSFATHMLMGGANLRVLQELLGHETLSATQKYTHLDLAYLSKTLENYHPLYHKKIGLR